MTLTYLESNSKKQLKFTFIIVKVKSFPCRLPDLGKTTSRSLFCSPSPVMTHPSHSYSIICTRLSPPFINPLTTLLLSFEIHSSLDPKHSRLLDSSLPLLIFDVTLICHKSLNSPCYYGIINGISHHRITRS